MKGTTSTTVLRFSTKTHRRQIENHHVVQRPSNYLCPPKHCSDISIDGLCRSVSRVPHVQRNCSDRAVIANSTIPDQTGMLDKRNSIALHQNPHNNTSSPNKCRDNNIGARYKANFEAFNATYERSKMAKSSKKTSNKANRRNTASNRYSPPNFSTERQLPSHRHSLEHFSREPRHHNSLSRSPVNDSNRLRQFLVTKERSNLHNLKYAPGIKPTDLCFHKNGAELSNSKSVRRRVYFEVQPEEDFAVRVPRRGYKVYGTEGNSLQSSMVLNSHTHNYPPLLYQQSQQPYDLYDEEKSTFPDLLPQKSTFVNQKSCFDSDISLKNKEKALISGLDIQARTSNSSISSPRSANEHEIEKPVQPVTHNKSGRDSNFVRRTEQSYENSASRNKATKMGAPAACSEKDFLLFQDIRKGTLQDASASLHMLHSDMQSSKDPRRQHLRQIGSKRCSGKKFPTSLVQILKLLPGNDRCNDCGKDESDGHGLLWASVTYGTILCKCCACRHLSRTKKRRCQSKKSEIKSLITSDWSLPEIMSMLEGGNLSFRRFIRETEAESIRSLFWDCVGGHDGDLDQPLDKEFEDYYFSKAAASYANLLEEKVLKIVDMLRSI